MRNQAERQKRILVIEPYYGGSHKAFLDGLETHLPLSFDLCTLPARKWKFRMRLGGPYFAAQLNRQQPVAYDCLLCSSYLDVAVFLSLAPEWLRRTPIVTYFHENQFAYPVQVEDERDVHFGLTNYTTALASDQLVFNSRYNLESFLTGCREILKIADDMQLPGDVDAALREKSKVLPPGIDFAGIDILPAWGRNKAPVIVWNHRWEHDKNPQVFFEALFRLEALGVEFELIVLGESFQNQPAVFQQARAKLSRRIRHFGYAASRREYYHWLSQGDLVVSTADHEFYGIAVLEAVRAGCRPLLPTRLSYPELFPAEYLYQDDDFVDRLAADLKLGSLPQEKRRALTERYSWTVLAGEFNKLFVSGDILRHMDVEKS